MFVCLYRDISDEPFPPLIGDSVVERRLYLEHTFYHNVNIIEPTKAREIISIIVSATLIPSSSSGKYILFIIQPSKLAKNYASLLFRAKIAKIF